MSRTVITLTTDFGSKDSYVAQMKGVILAINPHVQLIDVTHEVPPQHIRRAAAILDEAAAMFPAQSIHLAVVDPGVGSSRDIVAVEMADQRFIAPDNGVLSVVSRRSKPERAVRLTASKYWRDEISASFHGRDMMAPVAAHWSLGVDLVEFGEPLNRSLVEAPIPSPQRKGHCLVGEILWPDSFGNLVTNIDKSVLPHAGRDKLIVTVGSETIRGIDRCYTDRRPGELLALFGSSGRLEVAVNQGSASRRLGMHGGQTIEVAETP